MKKIYKKLILAEDESIKLRCMKYDKREIGKNRTNEICVFVSLWYVIRIMKTTATTFY